MKCTLQTQLFVKNLRNNLNPTTLLKSEVIPIYICYVLFFIVDWRILVKHVTIDKF